MKIVLEIEAKKLNDYSREEIKQFMENSLQVVGEWVENSGTWCVHCVFRDDIAKIEVIEEEK